MSNSNSSQGRYWILTIPRSDWEPHLPEGVSYVRGQCERGGESGYEHWQLIAYFPKRIRFGSVKKIFGATAHIELTRSAAAEQYCGKEETRIEGTAFEYGQKSVKRSEPGDWEAIWQAACTGAIQSIPGDVRLRYYNNIKRIAVDNAKPLAIERQVCVYWGPTGIGKSRRAWEEAGLEAYPKDPRSKFWDGYNGQTNVVIDEFRGGIDISHILRWLDRYPVIVEVKGSSVVLKATKLWITSNLSPDAWYPDLDKETMDALKRRINVTHLSTDVFKNLDVLGRPFEAMKRLGYDVPPERSWEAQKWKWLYRNQVLNELINRSVRSGDLE